MVEEGRERADMDGRKDGGRNGQRKITRAFSESRHNDSVCR